MLCFVIFIVLRLPNAFFFLVSSNWAKYSNRKFVLTRKYYAQHPLRKMKEHNNKDSYHFIEPTLCTWWTALTKNGEKSIFFLILSHRSGEYLLDHVSREICWLLLSEYFRYEFLFAPIIDCDLINSDCHILSFTQFSITRKYDRTTCRLFDLQKETKTAPLRTRTLFRFGFVRCCACASV